MKIQWEKDETNEEGLKYEHNVIVISLLIITTLSR